jgi:hypothetical protein
MDEELCAVGPSNMKAIEFETLYNTIKRKPVEVRFTLYTLLKCHDMVDLVIQYFAPFVAYILNSYEVDDDAEFGVTSYHNLKRIGILFSLSHYLYTDDDEIRGPDNDVIDLNYSVLEFETLSEMRSARTAYLHVSMYRTAGEDDSNGIYFIEEHVLMLYLKIMSDAKFDELEKEHLVRKLEQYILDHGYVYPQPLKSSLSCMPMSISDLMPSKKRKLYKQTTSDDTKRIKNVK